MKIPILCYHGISNNLSAVKAEDSPYFITPEEFEKQIKWLKKNNFKAIKAEEFLKKEFEKNSIIISFDDGQVSNYTYAFPILKKYGMKAIFFVIAGKIGQFGYLSKGQIKKMLQQGMEIGSHTVTHSILVGKNKKKVLQELVDSKLILEKALGIKIDFVAIPRGFYNERIKRFVKIACYQAAFTSKFGYNDANTELLHLKRITIKSSHSFKRFKGLVKQDKKEIFLESSKQSVFNACKKIFGIKNYNKIRRIMLEGK